MPKPGSTTARGYGAKHQAEREKWKPLVDRGDAYCWRCGCWLDPAKPWDLGHADHDRTQYRGPECRPCNRATKGRRNASNNSTANRWVL